MLQCIEFDACRVELNSFHVEFDTCLYAITMHHIYYHVWSFVICKVTFIVSLCPLLYCVSPMYKLAMLSSVHWHSLILLFIILFILFICPLLHCVSPMYKLAMLSSAHTFTHFLSSSCTRYFAPFHTYICAYCKCKASCIVSVSSLIQVLSSIVCILFMVQFVLRYFVYPINV